MVYMYSLLSGSPKVIRSSNQDNGDDKFDLPLPVVCVQPSTLELYEEKKHKVFVSFTLKQVVS